MLENIEENQKRINYFLYVIENVTAVREILYFSTYFFLILKEKGVNIHPTSRDELMSSFKKNYPKLSIQQITMIVEKIISFSHNADLLLPIIRKYSTYDASGININISNIVKIQKEYLEAIIDKLTIEDIKIDILSFNEG